MNSRLTNLLTAFLLLSVFSACAGPLKAYEGPNLSPSESARVEGWGIEILSVAGVKMGTTNSGARVAPGSNVIEFFINSSNFQANDTFGKPYKLELNAVAGKAYALTSARGFPAICAYEITATGDPDFGKPAGCAKRE